MAKRKPKVEPAAAAEYSYTCSACGEVKGMPKQVLPRFWKWFGERLLCITCRESEYSPRSVVVGVAEILDRDKDDVWKTLRECWKETARLSNWALTEILKHDALAIVAEGKLPEYKRPGIYNLGKQQYPKWAWWKGMYRAVDSILHKVEKAYKKDRWEIHVRMSRTPRLYRPQPFPIRAEDWSLSEVDGQLLLSAPLPGGRVQFRLRDDAAFKRQLAAVRKIFTKEAKGGELYLQEGRTGLMVRITAHLPKGPPRERCHLMYVRSDPNALWVAELEGRRPWILNADHVRRQQEAHRVYLQRFAEDSKFEKRWPRAVREQMNASRAKRCQKQNNWISTFCHQMSASLVNYGVKNKVAELVYDDRVRDYLPSFAWAFLKAKVQEKCSHARIVFTDATTSERV